MGLTCGAIDFSRWVDQFVFAIYCGVKVKVQVWACGTSGRADITDGLFLADTLSFFQAPRKSPQMTIAGFIAIAMFDFDIVAERSFASDKSDCAVGNGPDFCAVRRGVIYTVMSSVFFENGMKSTAGKWRTDAGKVQGFAQEKPL